jgi:hypothetical protein
MIRRFTVQALSGLITGVSAGGAVFAMRNGRENDGLWSLTPERIVVEARVQTAFAADYELGLGLYWQDFDSNPYTGGTDLSNPLAPFYRSSDENLGTDFPAPLTSTACASGDIRIAMTAALTPPGGSPVRDTQPFAYGSTSEVGSATTWKKGGILIDWEPLRKHRALTNHGFVIAVPVTMEASGKFRMHVSVEWREQRLAEG